MGDETKYETLDDEKEKRKKSQQVLDDVDEDVDDGDSDEFEDDEFEDELPDRPHLGEEQFDKTLEDKDYYKKEDERLQNELKNAKDEAEKDTMEIPPEKPGGSGEKSDDKKEDNKNEKKSDDESDSDEKKKGFHLPRYGPDLRESVVPRKSNKDKQNQDEKDNDKPSREPLFAMSTVPWGSNKNKDKQEQDKKDDASKDKESNDNKPQEKQNEQEKSSDKVKGEEDTQKKDSNNDKNDNREVVAVKDDGTKVVKKNESDHKSDQKNVKNAQRDIRRNKINETLGKAYSLAHPIEAAKKKLKEKAKKVVNSVIKKLLPFILGGIAFLLLIIILFCIIAGFVVVIFNLYDENGIAGYYEAPCQEIVVLGVYNENTGSYSQSGVYSVEEYVAGVLSREVGNANNMEVYKAFAIAIRTYAFTHVDSSCSIENSTRTQTFYPTDNPDYIKAANDTKGIVLTNSDGGLISTEYDSCHIKSEDSSFITITQKDQQIDSVWYETNKNKFAGGGHGRGMSQCGAYYLGDTGSSYEQILNYYYDNISFKSTYESYSVDGLEDYPLSSDGTVILRGVTLNELLASTTSDGLTTLDQRIAGKVNDIGYGTRQGVVAAAVTLIGEVGNLGYRIPYYWGGGQGFDGVSDGARSYWGGSSTGSKVCYTRANNRIYDLCGLDCGGFVNWAFYNGGYRTPASGSDNFANAGDVVILNPNEAVLQPGDLLHTSGHIVLVVGVDFSTNEYITAEANGYDKGVLFSRRSFGASGYEGVKMDSYYDNASNRRV